MRLTRATNYAVRALAAMGERGGLGRAGLATLAGEMGAPPAFLGKVLQKLKRAGIVAGTRGVHGGYSLARPAAEITVREVVEAVEGKTSLAACLPDESRRSGATRKGGCTREGTCRARRLWSRLEAQLNAALESETIGALAA
ncbi:MAG: RrF2 family transcriptional regulator, partial [Planctomycetota bacterium]